MCLGEIDQRVTRVPRTRLPNFTPALPQIFTAWVSTNSTSLHAMSAMSSRQRPSTGAPTPQRGRHSTAGPTPRRGAGDVGSKLPDYQAPTHPLNNEARQKVARLVNDRRFEGLEKNIVDMIECLSDNAGAINDAWKNTNDVVRRETAKKRVREEAGEEDEVQDERVKGMEKDFEEMTNRVEKTTQRIDENIRKMIDGQNTIANVRSALQEVATESAANANTQTTQNTQARSQRRRNNPDAEEEEDDEYQDFDPTDPTNAQTQATQRAQAPSTIFKDKIAQKRDRYQAMTLSARYSSNNDYRNFKRVVHDAQTGEDDGPPLAHERTWFNDGAVPAPGVTTRSNEAAADDSDDDIQIAKETISTKCPLTLQEFVDPVTSRKCPHSFEKKAIMGMIESPRNMVRVGGSGARGATDGHKAVRCPVSGCQCMITALELHADPVLKRKILRIQRANRAAEEDSGDDDEQPKGKGKQRAQTILSDDDDDVDVDAERSHFKVEPRSTAARLGASRTVVDDDDEDMIVD